MVGLEIRLLGALEVVRGGVLPLPPSKKTRALLGYLAGTGRPHSRTHLCDLLWEGPDDPRAALRWSLTKIRSLVDAGDRQRLIADHERVSLETSDVEVDLVEIDRALGPNLVIAETEQLIRAADRFRGEFLDDLDLPECYRYHEWWTRERESLRARRVELLSTLVQRLKQTPEKALSYARARVLVDPLSEAAHIAVIELLGLLGRPREGLQQYDQCRRILEDQLGARPCAALEHARGALTPSHTGPGSQSVTRAAAPARPLFGRAPQHDHVQRAVAAAAEGRSRDVLWMTGDPGIGKTRLLEDAADQVRRAGGVVLMGRAYKVEMVRPYGPWIDALRSTPLSVNDPSVRTDLAPLLPELGAGAAVGDRNRLFDAVVRVLSDLTTSNRPAGVPLDDVHWLDDASVALLHFVARALANSHVLIVCAARAIDLHDNPAVVGLVRALGHEGRLHHLPLGPLDGAAIRELIGTIGAPVDVDRVVSESEGNALFALEIAGALARGSPSLSDTVEELIAERLAQLDTRARNLVPWAAALGRNFSPDVLRRVSGLAPGELVAAMEDLERRGVIRASSSATAAYDFSHDLIREAAYERLSGPRRQIIHLQLAHALHAVPDPDAALAGDIAHHASLGGGDELAVGAAIAAGERSLRLFAYAEAYALVEQSLPRLRALPDAARIRQHLALLKIAVHASVGVPGARRLDHEISRVTLEAERAGLQNEAAIGYYLMSFRHHYDGNYAAAHDDTLRAGEAGPTREPADAARTLGNTGRCLALIERDLPRAESMLREAQTLAARARTDLVDIPWGLGLVRAFAGDYDEAVHLLQTALALADRNQDHWAECQCLQRLAIVELERGRPAEARRRAEVFADVAAKMGEGSEAPFAATLTALADLALGEPDAAARVEQAIGVLRGVDANALLSQALLFAAATDIDAGQLARASARAGEALSAARVVGRRSEIVWALTLLARIARQQGDGAAASQYSRLAADDLRARDAVRASVRRAASAPSEDTLSG